MFNGGFHRHKSFKKDKPIHASLEEKEIDDMSEQFFLFSWYRFFSINGHHGYSSKGRTTSRIQDFL